MTLPRFSRAARQRLLRRRACACASVALAQDARARLLDRLFGRLEPPRAAGRRRRARRRPIWSCGSSGSRQQIRQLTGTIEQLQFRNQQLEAAAPQRMEARAPGVPRRAAGRRRAAAPPTRPTVAGRAAVPRRASAAPPAARAAAPTCSIRRRIPNAPGAPRPLGRSPAAASRRRSIAAMSRRSARRADAAPGAPLDLSTLADRDPHERGRSGRRRRRRAMPDRCRRRRRAIRTPPARSRRSRRRRRRRRTITTSAYGYVLRKDYALAEDAFRRS